MSEYRLNHKSWLSFDRRSDCGVTVQVTGEDEAELRIDDEVGLDLLIYSTTPRSLEELVSFVSTKGARTRSQAESYVATFVSNSILLERPPSEDLRRWYRFNWTLPLYYHLDSQTAPDSASLDERSDEIPLPQSERNSGNYLDLPVPDDPPAKSLEEVLQQRRTCRDFSAEPMPIEDISKILFYSYLPMKEQCEEREGPVDPAEWTYADVSLLPFDIYLLVVEADGLERGIYRYSIRRHALVSMDSEVPDEELAELPTEILSGYDTAEGASLFALFTADFQRYQRLFPYPRALRGLFMNLSRIAHRLLLGAVAMDYEVFQSAALRRDVANDAIETDTFDESVLYMVAVGEGDVTPGLGGA